MGTIRPQIVLFGDSITDWSFQANGWGASLANHYMRKADVLGRGFAGYNSRWAQYLLDKIFPLTSPSPPRLVTIFFGANDASDPSASHAVLHVPLPEYNENIRKIVAHVKKQSASTHIVLITPPPIHEKTLLAFAEPMFGDTSGVPTRRNELTKLYADELVKVGEATGVRVINLWSTFMEAPNWGEKYLSDGLHLSAEGNAKFFEELVKVLEEPGFVPTLKPDQMDWDFPWFSDLFENPIATLSSWSTPTEKTFSATNGIAGLTLK